jgi:hypothetical protein
MISRLPDMLPAALTDAAGYTPGSQRWLAFGLAAGQPVFEDGACRRGFSRQLWRSLTDLLGVEDDQVLLCDLHELQIFCGDWPDAWKMLSVQRPLDGPLDLDRLDAARQALSAPPQRCARRSFARLAAC